MKTQPGADAPTSENLEWTDEMLGEALRFNELPATLRRKLGRLPAAMTKEAVKIRLDPDVLAVLRATSKGWQTRVNTILREHFAL